MQGRIELSIDEIALLETLAAESGNTWFSIRSPNFVWDNDNKVRLSVREAVKELLECSRGFLEGKDRKTLEGLYEKTGYFPDFDFDAVNGSIGKRKEC